MIKSNVVKLKFVNGKKTEKISENCNEESVLDCMWEMLEVMYNHAKINHDSRDYLANSMLDAIFSQYFSGCGHVITNFPWAKHLYNKADNLMGKLREFGGMLLDDEKALKRYLSKPNGRKQ